MRVCSVLVSLVVLCICGLAHAGQPPKIKPPAPLIANSGISAEALLAKDSIVYLRYDGLDAHRKAYDQTVLARLMHEDLGELLAYLVHFAQEKLGPDVLSERLLSGATPSRLLAFQQAAKGIPDVVEFLQRRGLVAGFEVIEPMPPCMQGTLVFPGAGKEEKYRTAILGAVRMIGLLTDVEVKTAAKQGREVLSFEQRGVKVAGWQEGDHMLLTIGTEEVDHTLDLATGKRPNLTTNPAYRQLTSFKQYETCARGLVDFQGLLPMAGKIFPPAEEIGKQLGLSELHSAAFHFGFAGKYQRSTVMLDTSGKRTGLLRLLTASEPISVDQLPSLPPDLTSVYASRVHWADAFDAVVEAVKVVSKAVDPSGSIDVDEQIRRFEKELSFDLRKDLLGALGSRVAFYNAPTQGMFSMGTALAVEVKDAGKFTKSLESLVKSLASSSGASMRIKTRKYRGVDLHMLEFGERGFPFRPTYAMHNGWFVLSLLPQPVQAFVMRSQGADKGFSAWRPPDLLAKAISEAKSASGGDKIKITSLAVTDPRPGVESVLSFAPFIATTIESTFGASSGFDVSLLPNPNSITDLIGPSVRVGVDDGRTLRIESYSTFPLPLEMSGLEAYAFIFVFAFARGAL